MCRYVRKRQLTKYKNLTQRVLKHSTQKSRKCSKIKEYSNCFMLPLLCFIRTNNYSTKDSEELLKRPAAQVQQSNCKYVTKEINLSQHDCKTFFLEYSLTIQEIKFQCFYYADQKGISFPFHSIPGIRVMLSRPGVV